MSEREIVLSIPKIKCDGCAATVQAAVAPLVENVTVDTAAKQARVTLLPDGAGLAEVRRRLEEAGYPPLA